MDELISFCGIDCAVCPARVATVENDYEKAKATAELWSKQFHASITPEDISCEGCVAPGKKFHHCTECEMRACGVQKGVKNCAWCDEYPCETLSAFFKIAPPCKAKLDEIRSRM